jgi:BirA family biotin operon repressor/biotin-[acetyl-CoA-carboxylase] ligase
MTAARVSDHQARSLARLLADARPHGTAELAAILGCRPDAVDRAVPDAAAALGLDIQACGSGYRLAHPLELLDAARLRRDLAPDVETGLTGIEVFDTIDSTHDHLLRRAEAGAASGLVCLAEQQSAGRGRRGRDWVSPFGGNLYLSLLWRTDRAPSALGGLSLAAGIAVAEAVNGVIGAGEGVGLKWPNDLHWRRRKLAGLLLEVTGDAHGPSRVVVGVGVNLVLSAAGGGGIDQPWVDLREVLGGRLPPRNALAAALINGLLRTLPRYAAGGLGPYLDAWRRLDVHLGEPVELVQGDRRIRGRHAGIDGDGALLLDTATGRQRFVAGEVSLRPLPHQQNVSA